MGDIDNDGDLDIFQANLGSIPGEGIRDDRPERSTMLLNLGEGAFLGNTPSRVGGVRRVD